jgi:hypothetical protein
MYYNQQTNPLVNLSIISSQAKPKKKKKKIINVLPVFPQSLHPSRGKNEFGGESIG